MQVSLRRVLLPSYSPVAQPAQGREVGVAPEMLLPTVEQVPAEADGAAASRLSGHAGLTSVAPGTATPGSTSGAAS